MIQITQVSTINELTVLVSQLDELVGAPAPNRLRWWFRGHLSADWDLLPSVKRGYTAEQERFLSNEFYARAGTRYTRCPSKSNFAGWLTLMQHYGLPTRLLDWTGSPLTAAYFATEHCLHGETHEAASDSCIWAIAPAQLNKSQGLEPYLYPLDAISLETIVIPAFKGTDSTDEIVAAMAVENDPRIRAQQGAFTVHSSNNPLNTLSSCEEWLVKIVIPREFTESLCQEIRSLGVQRSILFPDLTNLAEELKTDIRPGE
ncbi:MAG TPA: FRG domain-containing protein [Spirochaetia bacterium]|nr:FRG domain-containing protein [Spirochaetia bacterium]